MGRIASRISPLSITDRIPVCSSSIGLITSAEGHTCRTGSLPLISARLILAAMPVLTLLPPRKMPDRLEFATQPTAEFSGDLLVTLRNPTTGISAARAAVNDFVNARLRRGASVREVLGVIKSFKRQVRCNFMG
jgi:hypothetical protein